MATKYCDWTPSGWDTTRGLGCPDKQDWLVAPCSITRDSEALSTSNWRAMLAILEEQKLEHEICSFGHWACGWFEIALVAPTAAAETALDEISDSLDGYPILDESLFSELETEERSQAWESWGRDEFIDRLCKSHNLQDATRTVLESFDTWELMSLCEQDASSSDADGLSYDISCFEIDRDGLATWIREQRAEIGIAAMFAESDARADVITAMSIRFDLRKSTVRYLERLSDATLQRWTVSAFQYAHCERSPIALHRYMRRRGFWAVIPESYGRAAFASELWFQHRYGELSLHKRSQRAAAEQADIALTPEQSDRLAAEQA